ncbi:MAG: iron ABC transporter permease [Candidatus Eremiobacteraeota bacterium]|nr:iron ABC transporter permease [Candidatus Eremiobacteraeota bacterium]
MRCASISRIARALLLVVIPALALLVAIALGGTALGPQALADALAHPQRGGDAQTIVWALRFPRACIAALVGASLAIAGALLQGLLRNPLVDPYLTGVSAGAGAAIAIGVTAGIALPFVPALGFVAGLGSAIVVAVLGRRGGRLDAERLILAGVSLSALFAAIVALVLTRMTRGAASEQILAWLAGSVSGRGWNELAWSAPYAAAGLALALAIVPSLAVMRLGDIRAAALGVDVARTQWLVLAAASLLTAAAVALAGVVGFVGLIVPHVARKLSGVHPAGALPAAASLGAAFVILADTASRTLFAPAEAPLGVLLAFVGVPVFMLLYLRGPRTVRE